MSFEPFLYLILFLFFGLITFLARWLRGVIEKSGEEEGESKAYGLFQDSPAPFGYAEERPRPKERSIKRASSMIPTRSEKKRREMIIHPKNLQEMRRGVVLMTVLGPCRALEPPNESLRF